MAEAHDKGTAHEVAAMVVAYRRVEATLETLGRILACDPPPASVWVAVDGGERATAEAIRAAFTGVALHVSEEQRGPGGQRHQLLHRIPSAYVASFDDDSRPVDPDYFARVQRLFDSYPDADVLYADVEEASPDAPAFRRDTAGWVRHFVGCGCAYRVASYRRLSGYVPLPRAYGCEESDVALQLLASGGQMLYHPDLRVRHDSDLAHHASRGNNAASITNLALLAFLRYPPRAWCRGVLQVAGRVRYLVRRRRWRGIVTGLWWIPLSCWRYRKRRHPLTPQAYRAWKKVPPWRPLRQDP